MSESTFVVINPTETYYAGEGLNRIQVHGQFLIDFLEQRGWRIIDLFACDGSERCPAPDDKHIEGCFKAEPPHPQPLTHVLSDEFNRSSIEPGEWKIAPGIPLNEPQVTEDFWADSQHEALYQRQRWGDNDDTKTNEQWFWTLGWIVAKAARTDPDDMHALRHRLRAAAAMLSQWDLSLQQQIRETHGG